MDLNLAGKVAVVTGAGKGIGMATTRALADEGAHVVAGSRTTGTLDGLKGVTPVAVDLTAADGPAQRAHLKAGSDTQRFQERAFRTGGDVVTAVQGRPVHAESDLAKALLDYAPGDTVTLDVERGGQRRQVRVKLGERPLDAPRRG